MCDQCWSASPRPRLLCGLGAVAIIVGTYFTVAAVAQFVDDSWMTPSFMSEAICHPPAFVSGCDHVVNQGRVVLFAVAAVFALTVGIWLLIRGRSRSPEGSGGGGGGR